MEPLLVIANCTRTSNFVPALLKRHMIIFAQEALYLVETGRSWFNITTLALGTLPGVDQVSNVTDFVAGKLADRKVQRAQDRQYKKLVEDLERCIADNDNVLRWDYADLNRLVYRKSIRLSPIDDYIGFEFESEKHYFNFSDKKVLDMAVAIVKELAPQAEIEQKKGPMLRKARATRKRV